MRRALRETPFSHSLAGWPWTSHLSSPFMVMPAFGGGCQEVTQLQTWTPHGVAWGRWGLLLLGAEQVHSGNVRCALHTSFVLTRKDQVDKCYHFYSHPELNLISIRLAVSTLVVHKQSTVAQLRTLRQYKRALTITRVTKQLENELIGDLLAWGLHVFCMITVMCLSPWQN